MGDSLCKKLFKSNKKTQVNAVEIGNINVHVVLLLELLLLELLLLELLLLGL